MEGGWPVDRVAKRLSLGPSGANKIEAWESGKQIPTTRQVMLLAKVYKRPLHLFYQATHPRIPPLAGEYRRLPSVSPGAESPDLRLEIREMLDRRQTAIDMLEELGQDIPEFYLSATLEENPADVGVRLRQAAGISMEQQRAWVDGWQAWREWRSALEGLGVLVFMIPGVSLGEVRGLALPQDPLPVAAINTKESVPEARVFTALHEVVHLMLARASEEGTALTDRHSGDEWIQIERYAESAASFAIAPPDELQHFLDRSGGRTPTTVEEMRGLARWFKMTPKAAATRLRASGYLSWAQYDQWIEQWEKYLSGLKPRKGGPVRQETKAIGRAGQMFARLVVEALDTNRITLLDACRYLGLRSTYLDDLRQQLINSSAEETFDE
jgi:Zn-dependent peptidase ImmA (M78 family)